MTQILDEDIIIRLQSRASGKSVKLECPRSRKYLDNQESFYLGVLQLANGRDYKSQHPCRNHRENPKGNKESW